MLNGPNIDPCADPLGRGRMPEAMKRQPIKSNCADRWTEDPASEVATTNRTTTPIGEDQTLGAD